MPPVSLPLAGIDADNAKDCLGFESSATDISHHDDTTNTLVLQEGYKLRA